MQKLPNVLVVQGGQECNCLKKSLEELSNVVLATGVDQAIQILRSGDFNVVFSSWELDGGGWTDLIAALREQDIRVPAIIFYHCAGEGEWAKALGAGAFDLLAPPFDRYKLAVVLEHALASQNCLASVA